MLEQLKEQVFKANISLPAYKLVTLTWGNVSEIDRKTGYVAIKPSGVKYEDMAAEDIVIVDLNGNKVDGKLNPSSDTPTHLSYTSDFRKLEVLHILIQDGQRFFRNAE